MSLIIPQSPKLVVAAETSVVDLVYPVQHDDAGLKHQFLDQLPKLAASVGFDEIKSAPRKGDMLMIPAEVLDDALVAFGEKLRNEGVSSFGQGDGDVTAADVGRVIFGKPEMHAGGSLANTFDAMVHSYVDGVPLYDGKLVCMTGADERGQFFANSSDNHIATTSMGRQMVSHIIPVDGDRIMLTTPSSEQSPDKDFDTGLFAKTLEEVRPELIMVGGYLHFANLETNVLKQVVDIAEDYRASVQGKPTLVFTLAGQVIAEQVDMSMFSPDNGALVIQGNSGEMRRFLDMDTEWREPFNHYFKKGNGAELQGRDLELVKTQLVDYQNAKQAANDAAAIAAFEIAQQQDVTFIATNSVRPAFAINSRGIFKRPTPQLSGGQKVENTVGAGDNFVAGNWNAAAQGGDIIDMIAGGQEMSKGVIQKPGARLNRNASAYDEKLGEVSGPLADALNLG